VQKNYKKLEKQGAKDKNMTAFPKFQNRNSLTHKKWFKALYLNLLSFYFDFLKFI